MSKRFLRPDTPPKYAKPNEIARVEIEADIAEYLRMGGTITPAEEMPDPVYTSWPAGPAS